MAICCPVQIKSWRIRSSDSSRESWNLIFEKSSEFWVMLIKLLKHSGTKSKNYVDSWMLASAVLWGPRLPVVKCEASVVELSFHYFLQWSPKSSVASSCSHSCPPPFQAHWTSQTHSHLGNFACAVLPASNGLPQISPRLRVSLKFKCHFLNKAIVHNPNSLSTSALLWCPLSFFHSTITL